MKKVVFMCGSHRRHLYIANELGKFGRLAGLVIEKREDFVPVPPDDLSERDRNNFIHHFEERDKAETKFFSNVDVDALLNSTPHISVSKEDLNGSRTIAFLEEIQPDYLFSYGVHLISDTIIGLFDNRCFNLHGGLSPWYKGTITLFWPFYNLCPNWAGMTIHKLTSRLDAGEILHHSVPVLLHGDKMHEVACKATVQVSADLCRILDMVDKGHELTFQKQKSNGKLWVETDWTPQHLRVIYEFFDDNIVDMFLNGELTVSEPPLYKQF